MSRGGAGMVGSQMGSGVRDTTSGAERPPRRDIVAVFGLGVVGTLIPVAGWLFGVWLVARGTSWSRREKATAIVAPVVGMLAAVALIASAAGASVQLPLIAAVPLTLSISSAIGAIYLATRLVAHKRAAEVPGA